MNSPTRRTVLGSIVGGTVALAGCIGESETDDGSSSSDSGGNGDGGNGDGSAENAESAAHNGGDGDESDGNGGTDDGTESDEYAAWEETPLEDVRTGETFTIAAFDGPVLLETFAVWCSTCLAQQRESAELHERVGDDVVTVGLNVDPNEDAAAVREHADEHGFDWHFAVAPGEVTRSLVDEFGESMANPPSAPVVLRCPDGNARRLEDGVKSADTLEAELEAGC